MPKKKNLNDLIITEPATESPMFASGIKVEFIPNTEVHTVSLLAYADLPVAGERRIVARIAMSIDTAERLYVDLWKALRPHRQVRSPKSKPPR